MTRGAIAILPLALAASFYGFAFGVLAAQAGFYWWSVGLMGASVHAGSSQVVAVENFANTGAVLSAVFFGAILNLRYIGIVASLSEVLEPLPVWSRLLAIHLLTDENWALTMAQRARSPEIGAAFLIGSGLVMIGVWVFSTTTGALFGAALPDLDKLGLSFAFIAAFISMARGLWTGSAQLFPWLSAAIVAMGTVSLGASAALGLLFGASCGLLVAFLQRQISGVVK